MLRRDLLTTAAAALTPAAAAPSIPILDTHIHLFDPRRPQGIPWPPKDAIFYKPALPAGYREMTRSLGIVGAIEVECSPWLEDNQWVLDVSAKDTVMVGMIGNIEPGKTGFGASLDRFARNPLFRGIRFGYLWGNDLRESLKNPACVADIKRLASGGFTLDSANPSVRLLEDLIRVGDHAPTLKIVIDHLPKIEVSDAQRGAYRDAIRTLASRPNVFVKVSAVLAKRNGKVDYSLAPYKPTLDFIYDTFGQDRLLYGSDWPNSEPLGNYAQVLGVVREYFQAKGTAVAEKYFWRNSIRAYGWTARDKSQPHA